jgi:DNA (cytosine-5)-methyltransferase 1
LDWKAKWFSDNNPFCTTLLKHYYPDVPNQGGDMTLIGANYGPIDLLVGGTPCQSFSIAGAMSGGRKGLADFRGNLALEFCRIAVETGATWVVWENVPGALTSYSGPEKDEEGSEWEETSDFATFLCRLSECGYGWSYRVLNAEFFGSAQRRRRLLVVGYLGDWRPATAVLFEREGFSGNATQSTEKRKIINISSFKNFTGEGRQQIPCDNFGIKNKASCLSTSAQRLDGDSETFVVVKSDENSDVRRLTPLEYERLQGFPGYYTLIPFRGKPAADGVRYYALGNAFNVFIMRWLFRRLDTVDKFLKNGGLNLMS